MTKNKRFSWRARGKSFIFAFSGFKSLIKEHNMWIHICIAALVIILSVIIGLSATEWCLIFLCIGGVMMAEGFNTAIERVCDKVSPQQDPLIGEAKDIAACAVLIMAVASIAVGLTIFIRRIILIWNP